MAEFDELRGDGWRRLLAAARRRLDKTGGEPTGSVALADPSPAERRVVDQITDRYHGVPARRPGVQLAEMDHAIRRSFGVGLLKALAWLDRPDQPADMKSALETAMRCRHGEEGWFTAWLGELSRDGTVRTLVRQGDGDLLGWAAAVLDRMPAKDVPLPVLAEWATGDATALSGTPLVALVLRALVLWQGAAPPAGREAERRIWNDAGVLVDDLASQVLVLNLRVREDHIVGGWLDAAASAGIPFRLTLHQLMTGPMTPRAGRIFVCESPAVLRAAAAELGKGCRPLVCTEGRLSLACHRLLGPAVGNGARVHWRNDFNWAGLRMTAAATERYAATPWRMGADDYLDALEAGGAEPLRGIRVVAPWDERLTTAMTRERRVVREEWLLPALLADLRPDGTSGDG
jgi:uncharacterized protein (TIGR02679 family)